jgi:hypothetical protein
VAPKHQRYSTFCRQAHLSNRAEGAFTEQSLRTYRPYGQGDICLLLLAFQMRRPHSALGRLAQGSQRGTLFSRNRQAELLDGLLAKWTANRRGTIIQGCQQAARCHVPLACQTWVYCTSTWGSAHPPNVRKPHASI